MNSYIGLYLTSKYAPLTWTFISVGTSDGDACPAYSFNTQYESWKIAVHLYDVLSM